GEGKGHVFVYVSLELTFPVFLLLFVCSAPPAPPHSLLPFRDTDTSVQLKWQEPEDKDGILGYYLYYSEKGKQKWKTVNNKPYTKNSFIVHGLKTGREYVFRVKSVSRAGNSNYSEESPSIRVKAALRVPSAPSAIALLLCTGSEMVVGWRAPAHSGGDPVRGYYLDKKEEGADVWREVNVSAVKQRQLKVSNLTSGNFYQFRVFAANVVGVGKPSEPSEPFLCEKWTMPEPGCPYDVEIKEVRDTSLVAVWAPPLYEGQGPVTGYLLELSQDDQSDKWTAVNEQPISGTHYKVCGLETGQTYRLRVTAVNEAGAGCPSLPSEPITALTPPGTEDLGLYTVETTDDPGKSSSYDFTAEDLERLKELSWQVRNPLIELKSGWQVEVSEEGRVRLWLQTESLSDAAELRLIFNDREISSAPVRAVCTSGGDSVGSSLPEDQGSYTAQLKDGKAKNQCTLVFVDNCEFISFTRPHFQEDLSWSVTDECELVIKCKVTNTTKETTLKWFKEGKEIKEVSYDRTYKVVVSDKRGEDQSNLKLLDEALSAGPLSIECTEEGFRLFCSLKYYTSHLKTSWLFKFVANSEHGSRTGFSAHKVWIDILNPTEKDKGKFTLEMFDGKETHKRHLDLSGQVFFICFDYGAVWWKDHLFISLTGRAHVIKGLPDVVAIMEAKTLCLTCFVDGDPYPDIFWLRNDKEIAFQGHFAVIKEHKCTTITINNVTMQDSGKYSILVSNKYGSETVDVTVSVYKRGDKPPENAVMMG
uniref:Myomesin 3 n=1 Tax=Neogobius melanostomus TaxID=47308 RepID=A0A8C6UTK8_9GOBI